MTGWEMSVLDIVREKIGKLQPVDTAAKDMATDNGMVVEQDTVASAV